MSNDKVIMPGFYRAPFTLLDVGGLRGDAILRLARMAQPLILIMKDGQDPEKHHSVLSLRSNQS